MRIGNLPARGFRLPAEYSWIDAAFNAGCLVTGCANAANVNTSKLTVAICPN
jgi:hypothetical protein